MEAQMERERPFVICVVILCCSAESSVGVSVNGGSDGVGETPCIISFCFVFICRVFCWRRRWSGRDSLYNKLLFCVHLQSLLLESQLMEAQMERERPLVI